jgi:hypothetical protein
MVMMREFEFHSANFDGGYILGGSFNLNISGDKTENSLGRL